MHLRFMRVLARLVPPLLGLASGCAGYAPVPNDPAAARYEVRLVSTAPARIAVRATVPAATSLAMATSWPGNVADVAEAGWPGLVRNLTVTDAGGHALSPVPAGPKGWTIEGPVQGPLTLAYEVDYAPLAAQGWPAPHETAFADGDRIALTGRSIFITSAAQQSGVVRFELPEGWQAVTAWTPGRSTPREDLTENLLAFTRGPADVLQSGGFELKVVPFGHWLAARDEVRNALGAVVRQLVAITGFHGRAGYVVVLLPHLDHGAESLRASFAMSTDATPSRDNVERWANLVAHEVLHYWNGWRLRGADYASTQWFQEGFTEYGANLALVASGLTTPRQFHAQLARHVGNYRKLATPLDAPGTRKGPPLYSGGALAAFTLDGMLREASGGRSGYADLMRAMLRRNGDGARPYAWPDIEAALDELAPGPWADFHARHIHGTEPLPLAAALARVGLRLGQAADGAPEVEPDPAAGPEARARERALLGALAGR